jgi:biopolymer transport protein ExbD
MAGGASEDDAISVNVTPLIDVIFCLCLFFMCSFHFKQLEGKLDSWLPKDKGNQIGGVADATLDEMRIIIRLNSANNVEMMFGSRVVGTLDELESLIVQGWKDFESAGKKNASVIIDGEPRVPWRSVISVLDRCKKNNIQKVEFAQPMPGAAAAKPSSG